MFGSDIVGNEKSNWMLLGVEVTTLDGELHLTRLEDKPVLQSIDDVDSIESFSACDDGTKFAPGGGANSSLLKAEAIAPPPPVRMRWKSNEKLASFPRYGVDVAVNKPKLSLRIGNAEEKATIRYQMFYYKDKLKDLDGILPCDSAVVWISQKRLFAKRRFREKRRVWIRRRAWEATFIA